jgi:hypothetical protein
MGVVDNALTSFFGLILAGESKTYNDHNWYTPSGLKGYIEGRNKSPYPLLKKALSDYSVGEIMDFQSRGRDANGQLWATGRYQIIPSTLKGLLDKAGVSRTDKYDKKTQDKLGLQLLKNRGGIKSYIYGEVPDTTDALNKAITQTAMVWSSVGVPQDMKGHHKQIKRGESYYSGGGDRASVSPDIVGDALKKLRSALTGVVDVVKKNKSWFVIGGILVLGIAGWVIYRTYKNKPIIPKFK